MADQQNLFDGISKDHMLQAIQRIKEEGYPPRRRSSTYNLVFEGVTYPPKYVLSLAGYFRNKQYITQNQFAGGEYTPAFNFIKNLGFQILKKEDCIGLNESRENIETENKYLNFMNLEFFTDEDLRLLRT